MTSHTKRHNLFSFASAATTFLVAIAVSVSLAWAAPATFSQAKFEAKQHVYHDRNEVGTFYCECEWRWTGRSGGRIDFDSCGFEIRAQEHRAVRIEWEHVVPASNFGRARQCWQDGGRSNCQRTDPVFNLMEADLHNLTPSVGEINADRSNYRFGMLPGAPLQHGACDFRVDFRKRVAEPRDEIKGKVARIYFYMHDRYDLPMSEQQQKLFMAWDKQHPPSAWELERDRRIAAIMDHNNPFVTGARSWTLGHQNRREGIVNVLPGEGAAVSKQAPADQVVIRGNRNRKIYHLPVGCPSYDAISPRNIVDLIAKHVQRLKQARQLGQPKAAPLRSTLVRSGVDIWLVPNWKRCIGILFSSANRLKTKKNTFCITQSYILLTP